MNYEQANEKLTGRCKDSRKLCNNTYLHRRGQDIAVRLHSTDVITFHANGDISLNTGGWNTITTQDRINSYQNRARYFRERGEPFLQIGPWQGGRKYCFNDGARIRPDGQMAGYENDKTRTDELEEIYDSWREEDRENARQRYWIRKARGLSKRDSSKCKLEWCRCHNPRGGAQLGECECGCKITRVTIKTRLTMAEIMNESNITVRMAMAHCYGLEKFLLDAQAKTLDTHGEYALLSLPMGTWQRITALKMTCPSTGAVYISPVEPSCNNVSQALDWYFDTPHYLATLKAES